MAYILVQRWVAGLCGVLGMALSGLAWAAPDEPQAPMQAQAARQAQPHSQVWAADPPALVQARLVRLVRQDCGACHGLTLRGGLGSPLLPAQLADKPTDSLVATVLDGRPATPMPPWRGLLTPQEARWIVERLQTGFPLR